MKYTSAKSTSGGTWYTAKENLDGLGKLKIEVLVFDTPSHYGINDGKISKLYIALEGQDLALYDRGWETEPTDEIRPIYEGILEEFN